MDRIITKVIRNQAIDSLRIVSVNNANVVFDF